MKKLLIVLCLFSALFVAGILFWVNSYFGSSTSSPLSVLWEKPLEKYSFERLQTATNSAGEISIGPELFSDNAIISRMFYLELDPVSIGASEKTKVSGIIHTPKESGTYPILIQFRGFVPREEYKTGVGTRRSGEVFARNGFIVIAPDFLGYGQSSNPSENSIEERFQTYTTSLSLLSSLENINSSLRSFGIAADTSKVGLWGHSNGGHIALSVLSITKMPYPTVLWNPVSKPFPYSILYFTDEFADNGKSLRRAVAHFEKTYDIEKFSPANYYWNITASIELHQAEADEAVPVRWSNQLSAEFKRLKKDITYFTYPGDDHNFAKGSWPTVVERNISFFKKHL